MPIQNEFFKSSSFTDLSKHDSKKKKKNLRWKQGKELRKPRKRSRKSLWLVWVENGSEGDAKTYPQF